MSECDICAKNGQFGHNVSHSKHATNKRSLPNVHEVRLSIGGRMQKLTMCTRCLRSYQKSLA